MQTVFTVLILLLAVALSGIGARVIPRFLPLNFPLPLVQIALGAVLAWPGFDLHVAFDPDIFMLLFIPPLLFADGWRIPKRELYMARRSILMLALGLVFATVGAVGWFVHWLIPSIPLAVGFALAAVLSPTDAVALGGIAGRNRLPARLMHVLEGEALMNDASGLVALKFAVAAALTGVFSLRQASLSFVVIAIGGLAVGALIAWLFSFLTQRVFTLHGEEDATSGVIMTLLIPFAAYLFAEHFGWSGILAAVAAGMMSNHLSVSNNGSVSTRVRASGTWSMLEFVFNGMVFILLGLQFPHIIGRALVNAHASSDGHMWRLIGYVGAVTLALYLVRGVWVWLLRWFAAMGAARRGITSAVPGFHSVAIMTVSGVRGALTLAGVLSTPESLPGRDLAIFIASGVILVSLIVAVIGLPLLLRNRTAVHDPRTVREERAARRITAQSAIRAIEAERDAVDDADEDEAEAARAAEVTARVMGLYRRRLTELGDEDEPRELARRANALEFQLKLAAMRAERATLLRLRATHHINDETMHKLMREVDLLETALTTRGASSVEEAA